MHPLRLVQAEEHNAYFALFIIVYKGEKHTRVLFAWRIEVDPGRDKIMVADVCHFVFSLFCCEITINFEYL